jgi:pimeloyl-ACP methyl ester carboxylesterase
MIHAIPGLSPDLGAAVADPPGADRTVPPVVLVHGIHDNIRRWMHPIPGLPDPDWAVPTFDPVPPPKPISPRHERKLRLLEVLDARGCRALAFSYQLPNRVRGAIRPLGEATDALAAMVERARDLFSADTVTLVGHSRGGLVARSYLARAGTAAKVHRLVTLATPHEGSGVATAGGDVLMWVSSLAGSIRQRLSAGIFFDFETLLSGYRNLAARCAEIEGLRAAGFPSLRGGIAAAAGEVAAYVRYEFPFRAGSLPGDVAALPKFDIPEFRDGEGDMAVSVASALAVPAGSATRVFRANHLTLCHDAAALDWVVARVT